MSPAELAMIRSRIGMVFPHFNLWPHLVLGNLIEATIWVQRGPREEVIAEAEALLDEFGAPIVPRVSHCVEVGVDFRLLRYPPLCFKANV
jgi:ABC-type histidine transport system ATPase subunit